MADRVATARKAPAADARLIGVEIADTPARVEIQVGFGEAGLRRSREHGVAFEGNDGKASGEARIAVVADGERKVPAKRGRRKPKAKRRMVRWSAAREASFLRELGETANIAQAVRVSGLSDTSVRRHRAKSEDFRAKWAEALREGYAKLEMQLLEHALAGVETPVWHGGKQVGVQRRFDPGTGLKLLAAHRATVNGERPMAVARDDAEVRAAVAERLSEMNRKMGGAG